eukprot:279132-Pleurochrysis_carterae.AAC.3
MVYTMARSSIAEGHVLRPCAAMYLALHCEVLWPCIARYFDLALRRCVAAAVRAKGLLMRGSRVGMYRARARVGKGA